MDKLVVFFFGILGGISRFELGNVLPKVAGFPLATLGINLTGCFLLAYFVKNIFPINKVPEKMILGAGVGFIGSFTTFSSMMLEILELLEGKEYLFLCLYVALSAFGGYFMIVLGMKLGRRRR